MNIYLITSKANLHYDMYDGFVVQAEGAEEARAFLCRTWEKALRHESGRWAKGMVTFQRIGSNDRKRPKVLFSSYQAG